MLATAALTSRTGHEGAYWQNVKRSIDDCGGTLNRLQAILEALMKAEVSVLGRSRQFVTLERKSVELELLRREVTSYRETMKLSLHMISL